MKSNNLILDKSFDFSLLIIELYKLMIAQKEYVISRQLLRSSTSIGANVREATAAQTKKDFIAKMSIASKEARESEYWLMLLEKSNIVDVDCLIELEKSKELIKILTAIVKTAQTSLNKDI
ncbi:four helix bundle protein [Pseudopedobacter beijingensis]|uniref:Four helix bundle protein n=1 Tax=Pseudopedobacter beijingensis TaxID=1207056 RepID=A0ABW4IFT4_9SPHI